METNHRTALTRMAASVLRPLIKVLMRHDFSHTELTQLVRKTYVEVAYDAFKLPDQKMTYSRAAILTGLSRKEVVRLRGNILQDDSAHSQLTTPAMKAVRGWLSDEQFLDENGKPKPISIRGMEGSFETLVGKYCIDASYVDVLTDLSTNGITKQSADGKLNLVRSGYIAQSDELEQIRVMSVCVSDLFGTAVNPTGAANNDIRFQRQLVCSC